MLSFGRKYVTNSYKNGPVFYEQMKIGKIINKSIFAMHYAKPDFNETLGEVGSTM